MPPDAGGRGRKSSCLPEEPLILSRCERTAAIHCLGGSHRNRTPFLRNYQDHTGVIQYHLRKWTQLSLMLQMRKYIFVHTCCRSPHGERGLKSPLGPGQVDGRQSLPTRGAWIEIRSAIRSPRASRSRSPHGERGLKSVNRERRERWDGRSPHGERGLKYFGHPRHFCARSRSPHGERGLKLSAVE